jgi:integrase
VGKIRARTENNKLFIDFRYQGLRFREQTLLDDNARNRKQLDALLQRIEAKILLDDFNYDEFFPNSHNLKKLQHASVSIVSTKEIVHQVAESTTVPLPLLSEFAEHWFKEMEIQWRISHTRNIRSILDGSIIPTLGDKPINQITKADLMGYRTTEASRPGRNGNKTLSPKSINNRMGLLKLILDEAADRYEFQSPYKNIKPLKLKRTHIEPFSLLEVNRILDAVREDFRNYYAVRFFTGMRSGEIDGLKWEFVDFTNKQILVRETLVAGRTEYTKTDGSQREIPMFGPVLDSLRDQYENTANTSPYVFCNNNGRPLDQNNTTKRVWYPLLRHLGLKKRRPYQTRHTAATLFLAAGENPEWVARLLGHSSTEMLFKVYSRYIPNLTRMDGSAIERLLTSNNNVVKESNDDSE